MLNGKKENWYFISTTLKKYKEPKNYLEIKKLKNGEKITQLVYITPANIDIYNKYFSDNKLPIGFKKSLIPLKKQFTGENKSISRRLLKSYYL